MTLGTKNKYYSKLKDKRQLKHTEFFQKSGTEIDTAAELEFTSGASDTSMDSMRLKLFSLLCCFTARHDSILANGAVSKSS